MNLPGLVRNRVEIDPDIMSFQRLHRLENVLAIDGAIEIFRAPLPTGWGPTSAQVELVSRDDYPFDPEALELLTPYKNELAGLGWETKHRIVGLEHAPTKTSPLRVVLVPITYEEGTGFHRTLMEGTARRDKVILRLKERLAIQLIGTGRYSVPGVAVVHVVIITSDDRILLCQRSPTAGYHSLRWSASFEEQINEKDLMFGNAALSAAAVRGFQEEFACGYTMAPENSRILGLCLEYGILNIAMCSYVEAPLSFEEIKSAWDSRARDKWEHVAMVGEPFTPDRVVRLVLSDVYEQAVATSSKLHPTSKYRLLLAAICRFGFDAIVRAFGSSR